MYQLLQHTPGNVQLYQEGDRFEPLFDYLIEYFHDAVNHSVYYGDTAQFPTHQDWLKHVKDYFYELEPEGVFRQSYQGCRVKGWLTADGHYHLRLAYPGIQEECYWYIIWWD